jgi:hypothetical protein
MTEADVVNAGVTSGEVKSAATTATIATTAILGGAAGAATSGQLDIFDAADPLVGIEVNLPRYCPCGHNTLLVGPGRGPHRASLRCPRCGRDCGWLLDEIAKFICSVIKHFGRPTAPVCVRVPPQQATAESQIVAKSGANETQRSLHPEPALKTEVL